MKDIIKKVLNESIVNEEFSPDAEAVIDSIYGELKILSDSVKNRLNSKYRYPEDESRALRELEIISNYIQDESKIFLEKVEEKIRGLYANR